MKKLRTLSLYNGMGVGYLALNAAGIPIESYVSAEIDKSANMVASFNHPTTIQVGDVCNIDPEDYKDYDLVIGGSPCQSISPAGKMKGMTTNTGIVVNTLLSYVFLKNIGYTYDEKSPLYFHSSCLFWEFIRILRGIQRHNPNVKFLLENVVNKEWGKLITKELGVEPIRINSSVVSAQNRDRYYWTNIVYTDIEYKGYTLDHIIPGAVTGAGTRGVPQKNWVKTPENPFLHKQKTTVRKDGLANCLTASGGKLTRKYQSSNGLIILINIDQAEQLQTVPVGYTDVPGVTEHQRFRMLGNGWTLDVITHFFTCLVHELTWADLMLQKEEV